MVLLKCIKTSRLSENMLVTAAFTSLSGVMICLWLAFAGVAASAYTLGCAAVFGLLFSLAISAYSYAMSIGPLSYTTFFYSASMLIPTIAGIFLWDESVTWPVILGILLFLLAFYFISMKGGGDSLKANGWWLLICLLSFVFSGGASLTIKVHQKHMGGSEAMGLVGVGLAMAGISSFILYALSARRERHRFPARQHSHLLKNNVTAIVLMAACTGLGNILYTYLTSRVAGAYLFPVIAGGNTILVTLVSVVLFKEKLSRAGVLGMIVGVFAIIVLNL